ncbi:glycoside hydrolase family 88 protein [Paenibacillus contaminans]|uniref:Glycosyl hydrolase n=1 Tax=Paenibacillus contaminans TaxID=450362 RepID=A0A329LVD4_9BACL|nr:glycoside hydrolase family 88 protein [Paenibacillus contaminans]RAV11925.1 glycosyl hydrolase [Paenibacillus contaminans]
MASLDNTWADVERKVRRMAGQIGDKSPHVAKDGVYDDMRVDWWTSGFWPGILWIMYDMTGDVAFRDQAWEWDARIEQCLVRESNLHHDVGFQFLPTAVLKYRITGDADGRRRGLQAANFLAGRFNIAGSFLRAWNQDKTGWAIIDCSMNLSLLFWAAEEIADPRFRHIACAHAGTVLRHFIREDGSVRHIVSFDPETGEFLEALGGQGFGPDSGWSRGQAWALYGMANTHRFTGEARYLNAAKRVAHYFLASLEPDHVPLWDFRTGGGASSEPRDTSAASCAASGLLELAKLVPAAEAGFYRNAALRILASLTERYASLGEAGGQELLREGTGNKPAGQNVNVGLIYGDYYYVEALAKLKDWSRTVF